MTACPVLIRAMRLGAPMRLLMLPAGHPLDFIREPLAYHAHDLTHLAGGPFLVTLDMASSACVTAAQRVGAAGPGRLVGCRHVGRRNTSKQIAYEEMRGEELVA